MIRLRHIDAPPPDVSGKLVVGLDSWVWRRLAEAQRTKNSLYLNAFAELENRVRAGEIVVPLDSTVLFESHAWPPKIRSETAAVADKLSGWLTFLPPQIRIRQEMDAALREMFGRPLVLPARVPDVGWGAHFSMTGRTQRFAFHGPRAEIAAFTAAHGRAALQKQLEDLDNQQEREFMEGPTSEAHLRELRDVYGYRPEAAWEVATDRRDRHRRIQDNLANSPDLRARVSDVVNASELGVEVLDIFNERIVAAGITPDEFYVDGGAGLTKFLDRLPSSVIRRAIVRRALSDRGRRFSTNDLGDADLYAAVVPASDLVIAEKAALRALSPKEVSATFQAQLIGGRELADLSAVLDALASATS